MRTFLVFGESKEPVPVEADCAVVVNKIVESERCGTVVSWLEFRVEDNGFYNVVARFNRWNSYCEVKKDIESPEVITIPKDAVYG